jgi:GxxExxY protein
MNKEELTQLSNTIIGIAIEVHKKLGPGFIEKIYVRALEEEFKRREIKYKREVNIQIGYENIEIGGQRIDFLVEDGIILELKSVSEISEIHYAQLISYLKAADKRLGLVLNFGRQRLEIRRVVNNF